MNSFKIALAFTLPFVVAACTGTLRDPWSWLNDSNAQKWRNVKIQALGKNISFSVPDTLKSGSKRTEFWPKDGFSGDVFLASLSIEDYNRPATIVATFTWDKWWGGFYKKGGEDFYLTVKLFRVPDIENLLEMGLKERINWVRDYRLLRFSKPSSGENPNKNYFEENFWIESFEAISGQWWIRHNDPMVTEDHQRFISPIGDDHVLDFTFFVNKLRYDQKEDPQWNQSRWEMVEKIMKTVRITPDPFGSQPEEIPAR